MPRTLGRFGGRTSTAAGLALAALLLAGSLAGCAKKEEAKPAAGGGSATTPATGGTTQTSGGETEATGGTTSATNGSTGAPAPAPVLGADPIAYAPTDAIVYVQLKPSRLLASKLIKALPPEVTAKPMKELNENPFGIEPSKVEWLSVYLLAPKASAEPPKPPRPPIAPPKAPGAPDSPDAPGEDFAMPAPPPEPEVVFVVRATEPLDVAKFLEESNGPQDKVSEETHNGKKYTRVVKMGYDWSAPPDKDGGEPKMKERSRLGILSVDANTVFGGTESVLLKVLDGGKPGPLAERLKSTALDKDLVVVALPSAAAEFTKSAGPALSMLPGGAGEMVEQTAGEVKAAVIGLDLTGDTLLSVAVEGMSKDVTDNLEKQVRDGHKQLSDFYGMMSEGFRQPDSPEGLPKNLIPFGDKVLSGTAIERKGDELTVSIKSPGEWEKLVVALKPAIDEMILNEKRTVVRNNLQQVGIAFFNFHDQHGSFPPAKDAMGKGLSWRVHLLPLLGEEELYGQFKLDEPWDSDHNKALVEKMPEIYATPDDKEPGKGFTRFVGFSGEGALHGREVGLTLDEIKDGSSNTILAVIAGPDKAVVWTKPEDIALDDDPVKALGSFPGGKLGVLFADGSARMVGAKMIDPMVLKGLITFAGEEMVSGFDLGF